MRAKHFFLALFTLTTLLQSIQFCSAKVDLVTLPKRDAVQLTIYNSADLTLVRDSRQLTLTEGKNALQFSWANTLIDPTSLDLIPMSNADQIDILALLYPPRTQNVGIWNIVSRLSGKNPMKITYFTSGLSWRAFYMGTLTADEKTMQLQGYVMVSNNSGEDYEDAQTRLIVGKVHLLDEIATLARRHDPYGRPIGPDTSFGGAEAYAAPPMRMEKSRATLAMNVMDDADFFAEKKEIKKEGLSEYFLYTIAGTETIPNGWSKRLPSFDVPDVPVKNFYKYDEQRYGTRPMRFLYFKNDEEHQLGETPIPGGKLTVYRTIDDKAHLSYEGASSFQYIPVGEDVELELGRTERVIVEAKRMNTRTYDFMFNSNRDINGWLEDTTFSIEVNNTRTVPVRIEIKRNFRSNYWSVKNSGDFGKYEKVDARSVKYTLEIPPRTTQSFEYLLTTRYGKQAEP